MNVEAIMTPEPYSCRASDALNLAAQLMWEQDCGCLPVVDEGGGAVAMLTDRDACMAAYTQGMPLSEISVESAMSEKLVACLVDDNVATALDLMRTNKIRRIPVVDEAGALVGLVSLNDIAQEAASERDSRKKKEVTDAAVGWAFSELCEPRCEYVAPALHAI